ncbi:MAG: hypothetical protein LQ345_001983 [Seirophora villosa]|nr:MAG: hypothetical protein LQ345_001983 [Seirophora villosa]
MTSHPSPPPIEPDEHASTGASSSGDEEETQVELLVTGREKRSTAGTRMSTLLEREGDDELELLFAEDEQEEDEEFEEEDADDADDVQLDSASSDDEQGPAQAEDDLTGEKELQRQTRVERQKKRKAQDAFLKPRAVTKRTKLMSRPAAPGSTATPTTPVPRAKKKLERMSWLPTPEEGPVRASSRKQTVQNKAIVHSRLVASEKRRVKQLKVMEEAAKRKEASKPKAMTQAQRMEEAARTERLNAKSLNRWETAEKKRLEEQKAKLEALHSRQLTGPVISWWSGMARWVNGKLEQVGWKNIKEAEAKATLQDHAQPADGTLSEDQKQAINNHDTITEEGPGHQSQLTASEPAESMDTEHAANARQVTFASPQGFLDGIHYYASLPEQRPSVGSGEQPGIPAHAQSSAEPPELVSLPAVVQEDARSKNPTGNSPSDVPAVEYTGRNFIILENINGNAQRIPELQNNVLLKRRRLTQVEKQKVVRELCAITERPARYRDPKTGLPYADSYAYKEIQKLAHGGSRWSSLLGCYVGPTSSGARGVPECFWTNG